MKSICILLNGGISNDARVIKTIKSISKIIKVDLVYVLQKESDRNLFNNNVKLIPLINYEKPFIKKIKANLFFYKSFSFFSDYIIKTNKKYDYIWSNDLPTLLPAVNIKKKLGNKPILFYDSHEIFIETLNQFYDTNTNSLRKNIYKVLIFLMRYLGKKAEKKLMKEVDVFITVGNAVAEYFHDVLQYQKPIIIKNCPSFIKTKTNSNLLRAHYNLKNDNIIFLYQGVLNKGRALELVVRTFIKTEEKIKLVILGDGLLKKKLQFIVKESGIENKVFFKNKVNFKELFKYTVSADFGINYVEPLNQSKKLASPNKVFEYIQNELPILMSNSVENNAINNKYRVGVCTELNENAILKGINNLIISDKNELNKNIKIAKNLLNWENEEIKLLSLFKEK